MKLLFLLFALFRGAYGRGVTSYGEPDWGFIGYSIKMYPTTCGWSCIFSLSPPLNCTYDDLAVLPIPAKRDTSDATPQYPSGPGWIVTPEATPQCRAHNVFYLQAMALCLQTWCANVSLGELEAFWDAKIPWQWGGDKSSLPVGSRSYTQVLEGITEPPTQPVNNSIYLNYTGYTPSDLVMGDYIPRLRYIANEIAHERSGLIIFLSGVAIPIGVSLLRFLPWPTSWATKFNAYLVDPPLIGNKHSTPIWSLGIMPTRGQALFIAYLWLLNILVTALGYDIIWPTDWYDTISEEVQEYVADRTGILSLAWLPLVFLYAGRNNFLLWVTNWSHSTFMLLHRWAAFMCMLQAVLHSLIYLHMAVAKLDDLDYATEAVQPYWYWGIIGTLAMVLLVVLSLQVIRRKLYEVFLALHIVFAVLALVGCFYHIEPRYGFDWGYQTWMYLAVGVWVFDRAVRLMRSLQGGLKRAYLTPIDDHYYRLDIPHTTAAGHVFLHFPTISLWRFWENHPFSIAGVARRRTSYLNESTIRQTTGNGATKEVQVNIDQHSGSAVEFGPLYEPGTKPQESGIVMFIRKRDGFTSKLLKNCDNVTGALVMVEGSYAPGMTPFQDSNTSPTHDFPNLLCIAGGVGITGVMTPLNHFSSIANSAGYKKLYWGVRSMPLVNAVEHMLGYGGESTANRTWGDVNVTLSVGERLDLKKILETELKGQQGGTIVMVCGPSGMADEVRCIVSGLARHAPAEKPIAVKLVVESFFW